MVGRTLRLKYTNYVMRKPIASKKEGNKNDVAEKEYDEGEKVLGL